LTIIFFDVTNSVLHRGGLTDKQKAPAVETTGASPCKTIIFLMGTKRTGNFRYPSCWSTHIAVKPAFQTCFVL